MGFFFGKKKLDPSQPHPDWPWTLSEGGNILRDFTWENIEYDLAELYPDSDSFLILEQKDPADPKRRYWYIQCAIALQGPSAGQYSLEVGYREDGKGHLLDRTLPMLEQVTAYFDRAFRWKPLDLSAFEDMSDMVQ